MRHHFLTTTALFAPSGGRTGGATATPRRVLNEREASRYTGISVRTLQRLRAEGDGLAYVRLGGRRIGYTVDALDAWLASRTFTSADAEAAARRDGGTD